MTVAISVGGVSYDVPNSGTDTNWAALQLAWEQAVSAGLSAPTWIAPTLINSWANIGGSDQIAGYYRDATSRVWLRGSLHSGSTNTVAFVLPTGYRPAKNEQFVILTFAGVGKCAVSTAGNVTLTEITGTIGTLASLGGLSFSTTA